MATRIDALSADEKEAVTDYVRGEYDKLVFQHPTDYVTRNVQAEPEGWQRAMCELIASDYGMVEELTRDAQRQLSKSSKGFTLIELSIVLVIIGLIVGGVLVGQSLINAAAVRAQITQIEKYNTAANTVYGKYGGLPGDLPVALAQQFAFPNAACSGTVSERDGNGIIDSNDNNSELNTSVLASNEPVLFWEDLSYAHLIDGTFNTGACSWSGGTAPTVAQTALYMPYAKINGTSSVYVYAYNHTNYFGISAVTSWEVAPPAAAFTAVSLSVAQAYAIDKKVDDGLPMTGAVMANFVSAGNGYAGELCPQVLSGDTCASANTATSGGTTSSCYDTTSSQYSVAQSGGANINCGISFKMQAGD